MAKFLIDGANLVLSLSWREKVAGFHANLHSPLSAIRSVKVVEKPWMELRGWRMAGFASGSFAMGTRRHGEGFDFTILRGTGPAVQVELASGRFGRWVVSVPEGIDPQTEANRVADAAGISRSGGM